jgi:hypothetical protein
MYHHVGEPLQISLNVTNQRLNQYTLVFNSSRYSLTLNPAANT